MVVEIAASEIKTAANILQSARYALRWNTPEIAAQIQDELNIRISSLTDRSQSGPPTERAETRHVLAKTREGTLRLNRLGLASGANEDPASGMVFGIPANPTGHDSRFPDFRNPASVEWLYMPHAVIEESYNVRLNTDPYVSRAVLELITGNQPPRKEDPVGISKIDLDPIALSSLLRIARGMKDNNIHGRIPTRREEIINNILHSGKFPTPNITQLPESSAADVRQSTLSA